MILVDYSTVSVSNFARAAGSEHLDVDIDSIRHMIMNSIRKINVAFRREYGEMVLAVDAKHSWRKEVFPYYKASRAKDRKKSNIDWKELYRVCGEIREEFQEWLPYKVICADLAEADDIIGVLARHSRDTEQPTVIVSEDKDFIQLQIDNSFVKQFGPIRETWIGVDDPKKYLFEHVIKGDRGDGIPNILSPNDALVTTGTRQKSVFQKKLDEWWEDPSELQGNPRLKENIRLIDLNKTPKAIVNDILTEYTNYETPERSLLWKYMVKKKLNKLTDKIKDF